MTAAYVPPMPNCGHRGGVTFTRVALIELWLCELCFASIGALYQSCAKCGRHPAIDMPLTATTNGRLCQHCLREFRAGHRGASS